MLIENRSSEAALLGAAAAEMTGNESINEEAHGFANQYAETVRDVVAAIRCRWRLFHDEFRDSARKRTRAAACRRRHAHRCCSVVRQHGDPKIIKISFWLVPRVC